MVALKCSTFFFFLPFLVTLKLQKVCVLYGSKAPTERCDRLPMTWAEFSSTPSPSPTPVSTTPTDKQLTLLHFIFLVPRSGPRNLRVSGETTNSLSVSWDHADGPVHQYRVIYSPTVGDPIDEYVSPLLIF